MRAIVPIIGLDLFTGVAFLKERVDELITSLGLESYWVTVGNIRELHNADPREVDVPLIVVAQGDDRRDYSDLHIPLLKKYPYAKMIEHEFVHIPHEIYKVGNSISLWKNEISSEIVKAAIKTIYKTLALPSLSIEKVARDLGISYPRLDRLFKSEMGKTPYSFVVEQRVAVANRLLANTNLPVNEVAFAVGYTDLSAFDKIYKKKMMMSPLQYRKSI